MPSAHVLPESPAAGTPRLASATCSCGSMGSTRRDVPQKPASRISSYPPHYPTARLTHAPGSTGAASDDHTPRWVTVSRRTVLAVIGIAACWLSAGQVGDVLTLARLT